MKPNRPKRLTPEETERYFAELPARSLARLCWLTYLRTRDPQDALEAYHTLARAGIAVSAKQWRALERIRQQPRPKWAKDSNTVLRNWRLIHAVNFFLQHEPRKSLTAILRQLTSARPHPGYPEGVAPPGFRISYERAYAVWREHEDWLSGLSNDPLRLLD